jgi:hypothetical protein
VTGVLLLTLQVSLIGALASLSIAAEAQDHSFLAVGPALIAAVGTVAAFCVTFALFWRGSKDRIREQASKVYAATTKDGAGKVTATVHNASDLPIWHVEARPLQADHLFDDGICQPAPDLNPKEACTFVWPGPASIERDWRIRFTDAAGRGWIRVGNRLTRDGTRRARMRDALRR